MRSRLISSIFAVALSFQANLQAATPTANAELDGWISKLALDDTWRELERTSQSADFERTANGKRTTLAISTQPIESLPDDQDFLRFAESRQASALSKLEKVSVHYNWTSRKGTPCLAYDGIFQNRAAQTASFLSFRGLLCRHPGSSERIIHVELAQRTDTKQAAYEVDLYEMAEHLLSAVPFGEPAQETQRRY